MKAIAKATSVFFILCASFFSQATLAGDQTVFGTVQYIYQRAGYTLVAIKPLSGSAMYLYNNGSLNEAAVALSDAASSRQTVSVGYYASTGTFDTVSRQY